MNEGGAGGEKGEKEVAIPPNSNKMVLFTSTGRASELRLQNVTEQALVHESNLFSLFVYIIPGYILFILCVSREFTLKVRCLLLLVWMDSLTLHVAFDILQHVRS